MTLIEALKTGRKFKRKIDTNWHQPKANYEKLHLFVVEDILADDWEVQPIFVTITREQFDAAWDEATHANPHLQYIHSALLKELGL